MLAGNALLHKMGAVTPNRKLVVSPGKLHLVKNGTTHTGSKLGLRTFVDQDAALTVVVVAALTNILGEIPCQLGGKTHAPALSNPPDILCGFFMIFHEKKTPQNTQRRPLANTGG
jgi:hypothetical protein